MPKKNKFVRINGIKYVWLKGDFVRVFTKIYVKSRCSKLLIKKHCEFCGKEFLTLLYNKTECCSVKCGNSLKLQIYVPGQDDFKLRNHSVYCVYKAIKLGKLKRPQECPFCNKNKFIEAHHPNYFKPNEIMWLCISCHRKLHAKHYIQSKLIIF